MKLSILLLIACFPLVMLHSTSAQSTITPTATDAPASQPNKFGIKKHGAIVYRTGDTYLVKCDIYQPIPDVKTDQPMPAVVMIHGGAWRTGSKISMFRHARRLARVGYVVMVINYRLAPKYPWPAQIEDCRAALDWLHRHAEQYNIDTDRVGVYGYSAGAHLASMLATTNEQNDTVKIRAAAVGGTPAEFSWIDADANTLAYWLGSSRAEGVEVYRNASPITFVTPDDPPFFAFHGKNDMVVPLETVQRFHAALDAQNVNSTLVEIPNCGHIATFSRLNLMADVIKFFDEHLSPPVTLEK